VTTPLPPSPALRIAVIGGGFCGAFFAVRLADFSEVPLSIAVIEPRERLGGGVAYSSTDPAHRINVPASRMILFPDMPEHFDRWFREGAELAADAEALWHDGHAYPRRAAFGRYIAGLVADRQATRPHAPIAHVRDRAITVSRLGQGYRVQLEAGGALEADLLVIATSHPPPGVPPLLANALGDDKRLIANPWAPAALDGIAPDESVAIIGTGLTMADIVASLARRGHKGPITALSRRGQLSRGHAPAPAVPFTWFDTHETPTSIGALLRLARARVREAAAEGYAWQAVFDNLRGNAQTIWRRLDESEKRRFLRHLRVYWDVHRYRIAPQIESVLKQKQQDGSLTVRAASLRTATSNGADIRLTVRPRHSHEDAQITARHVVVTTGPDHGTSIARNPVLASLARQGLVAPDALGLGLAVDASAQSIQPDGTSLPNIFVVGPLARAQYGELMGLPQVAAQPDATAAQVAQWATASARKLSA
jgi:uncharacterized NAD(P)/FAD-binding protein YdhS